MRGLVMSSRSVYSGLACLHCGRSVRNGRAFLGTTMFIDPERPERIKTFAQAYYNAKEIEVRVVYHRACLDKVLSRAPLDIDEANEKLQAYRQQLLERYGLDQEHALEEVR